MAGASAISSFEIVVPVASGEEDVLLGETLNAFAQTLAGAGSADSGMLIVKSEYGEDGLVKTVIFEEPGPADAFRDMWRAARRRLTGQA